MKQFYLDIKAQIDRYLPELKGNTYRWNSQFGHSNFDGEDGRNEAAFNYPVVFIELNNMEYTPLSLGVREINFEMTVRLGYKSFLKEDNGIFDLAERLDWVCERFQSGNSSRLKKRSENWDTNSTDVNILTMVYDGYTVDYNRYVFVDDQQAQITGITNTETIVYQLTGGTSWSGLTDDNGNNRYQ